MISIIWQSDVLLYARLQPHRADNMFIRFQSTIPDRLTGKPLGIFHASTIVCELEDTSQYAIDLILEQRKWFNKNLPRPHKFSRSRKPHALEIALSWYRPSATEFIERSRVLANLLSDQIFPITMVKSLNPGVIVYEDDYQVVAVPFRQQEL